MALVVEEQVGLQRPRISVVIPARNEAQNLIIEQVGQSKEDALEKRAFLRVKCYFYLALKDELYLLELGGRIP
jgi:hypothetical protein